MEKTERIQREEAREIPRIPIDDLSCSTVERSEENLINADMGGPCRRTLNDIMQNRIYSNSNLEKKTAILNASDSRRTVKETGTELEQTQTQTKVDNEKIKSAMATNKKTKDMNSEMSILKESQQRIKPKGTIEKMVIPIRNSSATLKHISNKVAVERHVEPYRNETDFEYLNSGPSTCSRFEEIRQSSTTRSLIGTSNYSTQTASIDSNVTTLPKSVEQRDILDSTSQLSVCTSNTSDSSELLGNINIKNVRGQNNDHNVERIAIPRLDDKKPYIKTTVSSELLNKSPTTAIQNQTISHHQRQPLQVFSHRIMSVESQGHTSQVPSGVDPTQERFLITVPKDPNYLNSQTYSNHVAVPQATISNPDFRSISGRRSITLRLVEDKDSSSGVGNSFFSKSILKSSRSLRSSSMSIKENDRESIFGNDRITIDLGTVVVSWYHGTTSLELQNHVRNSVNRKLGKSVDDIRLLDESVFPHEEIVLTPFIPDGSRFMVKFKIRPPTPTKTVYQYASKAPDSPSRAPTPYDSEIDVKSLEESSSSSEDEMPNLPLLPKPPTEKKMKANKKYRGDIIPHRKSRYGEVEVEDENDHETKIREINKKFNAKRRRPDKIVSQKTVISGNETVEKIIFRSANTTEIKKHVIFVLANYFVLFISIIAISAEIHVRGPRWMQWMEQNVDRVNECAVDRDSLFECVSNGDIYGLLASIIMWAARNNTLTTRIFLFGFHSVDKLWTVVYEALVTAFCWGTSYMFIRRGLNPDTRANFLEKYWKDAIYGSLAGFNAAFMKAVLKNLIPKEVLEEMVDNNRQLGIVEIFAKIFSHKN